MTITSSAVLRLGLSDVAQLAHVQRPVVSMWRARSAGSDRPFPAAIDAARGQEWFDGTAVVDWLIATGRGNNPTARDDLAAYASLRTRSRGSSTMSTSTPATASSGCIATRGGRF